MGFLIAIDGPAGSGKSTVAKAVASRLGFGYLDTGAMYRAVAWAGLSQGLARTDADGVLALTESIALELSADPNDPWVRWDGRDVTEPIRRPEVSAWVSTVATNPGCRSELVDRQRAIVAGRDFVLEGRDTTTVVAPQAQVRVLLVADPEVRLRRRGAELGPAVDRSGLVDQVLRRDREDSALVEFERPASGVTVIDSTELTVAQVVDRIVGLADQAGLGRLTGSDPLV
ncbi:MAG: (d)CMP kinase [Propionibacteriaceae bacterium]|jgi:cytidylate kinase|nr:(d)CMP kinase [Propionibacteriaceae bacterium]